MFEESNSNEMMNELEFNNSVNIKVDDMNDMNEEIDIIDDTEDDEIEFFK